MHRIGFKMKLFNGCEDEYKKRHDEIPDELISLLKSAGISEYYIFLDDKSGDLFGVMNAEDEGKMKELSSNPVMKKWWNFMKDIMDTNEDNSPASIPLKEVFYMK